jgi:hypothetical protein
MNAFELSRHIAARLEEDQLEYAIGGALALTARAIRIHPTVTIWLG